MRIFVANWRCIERVEFDLSKINVFMGPNGVGKSSLAYAIYFASKIFRNPRADINYLNAIAMQLYGCGVDGIVRRVGGKAQWPMVIEVDGWRLSVDIAKGGGGKEFPKEGGVPETILDISLSQGSPWSDEYLFPSRRLAYLQILMLLPRILRDVQRVEGARVLGSMFEWVSGLLKDVPLLPPFPLFAADFTRALTGVAADVVEGGLGVTGVGTFFARVTSLISLISITYTDYFSKQEFPLEGAADGQVDVSIIDLALKRVPDSSLVVIEEPEVFKNPLTEVEFARRVVERVLEKKSVLVLTTHSDLVPITIAKMVAEGRVRVDDIRVYYLERDPWTKLKELEVYEDGTLEELPDSEKIMTQLF